MGAKAQSGEWRSQARARTTPGQAPGGRQRRRAAALHMMWAESEDTRKMFTPGPEFAQVVVGVKKNRPRSRGDRAATNALTPGARASRVKLAR
jgi:hypothetical protein